MPSTNPFISAHVPILWNSLIREFGKTVDYWPMGEEGNGYELELVWMEGAANEEVSPGRYSSAFVKHSEMQAPPALGDSVSKDGQVFDVVRIDAYAYECSRVVFQERDYV